MEQCGSSRLEGIGNAVRKKRTRSSRRRPESGRDISSSALTPPSDDVRAGSSDDNSFDHNRTRRKVVSLSQYASKFPGAGGPESEETLKKNRKPSSQGTFASANRKAEESSGPSVDGLGAGTGSKVKKVKLKLGGVTRTIDAVSSLKNSCNSETTTSRHKGNPKDVLDSDNSPHREKRSGLQGIPWKDFSRVGISLGREESLVGKGAGLGKNGSKPDSARKSRRAPKKRAANGLDDDDESDDEIRYLEKLKNARLLSGFRDEDEDPSRKHRPQSLEGTSSGSGPLGTDGKKRSSSEDTDFDEDGVLTTDCEPDGRKKKKARRESIDSPIEPKRELTLTSRQRALHSSKDASANGGSVIEFPNGLPPAPSRKQKEVLTEVEQQLKKAEAAQRRKMQNEKAARECEASLPMQAEAIRKILGQDSSRKKKEDKKKKRVADLAQEKAADELMLASSTVRLVMGPNGTTVTFPNEMGLPSIFTSGPCRYPPPREKCAGPSCINPYKYRDSKTKLPLCSLQCYKAVQGNAQSEAATC